MCGIIGYTGHREALPVLLQGLKAMEYRGYDSSGICFTERRRLKIFKKAGRIAALEAVLPLAAPACQAGIGHTRWATHGSVNDANAHPHAGFGGLVAVAHNGIIDNHAALRAELQAAGVQFASATDTEVIAHLIERELGAQNREPQEAVNAALRRLQGTWGLVVLFRDHPDLIVGAKNGSPLMIGAGEREMFLASDPHAFLGYTRQVIFLEDGDTVVIRRDEWKSSNLHNRGGERQSEEYPWQAGEAERGEYAHFYVKEIFEQPEAVARACGNGGRLMTDFGTAKLGGLNMDKRDFLDVKRVVYFGMGSAYYAAQVGARQMERLARIPATAEDASELRYSNPIVDKETLYFAITQSGETADTIAAMQELQHRGARVLGIVNCVGSTVARLSDGGVYIHAGPEISVTTSKAFSAQLTVTTLLALLFARMRTISLAQGRRLAEEILDMPERIRTVLGLAPVLEALADTVARCQTVLFLGRGLQYPIALEGALKLKEVSYIHAEGYPAGALKHGPLALIGPDTLSVFLLAGGETFEKTLANMEEVRARHGRLIAVTNYEPDRVAAVADEVIRLPASDELLAPLLSVIPLQLLSYYTALRLGRDIDHPRNLAKSVTTE